MNIDLYIFSSENVIVLPLVVKSDASTANLCLVELKYVLYGLRSHGKYLAMPLYPLTVLLGSLTVGIEL